MSDFDYGFALSRFRAGAKCARRGWNGRGMWVGMMPGYPDGIPANAALGVPVGIKVRPYLVMLDAQGFLVPWLASQTDQLADDWYEVA